MTRPLLIAALCILLMGCSVCRFQVLYDAGMAYEQGYEARVMIYEMGGAAAVATWPYTGHSQLQIKTVNGWQFFNGGSDFPVTGRVAYYTPEEWMQRLKEKQFQWQGCAEGYRAAGVDEEGDAICMRKEEGR